MDTQGIRTEVQEWAGETSSIFQASVYNIFTNIPLGKAWHGLVQSPEVGQNISPTMGEVKN